MTMNFEAMQSEVNEARALCDRNDRWLREYDNVASDARCDVIREVNEEFSREIRHRIWERASTEADHIEDPAEREEAVQFIRYAVYDEFAERIEQAIDERMRDLEPEIRGEVNQRMRDESVASEHAD